MTTRRRFLAGLSTAALTVAAPTPKRRGPSPSPIRTGAHLTNVPQLGLDPLLDVEQRVGHLSTVHWFQAWGEPGTWSQFQPDWWRTVRGSGRTPLLTWEPWAYTSPDPGWNPAAIVNGDHDDYIDTWVRGFATLGAGPWYVRPMHEMNGTWYPWGNQPPALYRQAWRHIVDRFETVDVRWVWCPNVDDVAGHPLEDYWPGRRYVDVIGLDGYNWGADGWPYGTWRTPAQVFDKAIRRVRQLNSTVPLWIVETGCSPDGGNKAAWVSDLYQFARSRRVASIIWFAINKEHDWRIDVDPAVAAAVRRH